MTQQEQVLNELRNAYPKGLTSNDLHERLKIKKNVLTTVIWELRNDDLITRIGGKRGSYLYTLTQAGRNELKERTNEFVFSTEMLPDDVEGYAEIMKMVGNVQKLKELRSFVTYITSTHVDDICTECENGELEAVFDEAILGYLGVDKGEFEKQREALEVILSTF